MNSSGDNRGSKIDEERTGEGEQEDTEREMRQIERRGETITREITTER